ncbi:MAG: 3-oxoacyl-ACP synthase III [Planctomycetia bacterium]|nr:3-oxoacyl-ACP synthase III [Planctomycetia bacterium]
MLYKNVFVEAFSHTLPEEVITTEELERSLTPLYERLKLPFGRLELMTGIKERRLWKSGTLPGDQSVQTVERLIEKTGIDRESIGAFIHASVCRDYQEPATACSVHDRLRLSQNCAIFDISNACLGILTGMTQIANMIELGQIEAGIVVGTENSRTLLETTIPQINGDLSLTRKSIKTIFATLTIGSGSAAVLLTNEKRTRTGNRLLGGVVQANTKQSHLCRSELDVSAGGKGNGQFMRTDSETLLHEGVQTAKAAFQRFCPLLQWNSDSIARTFCHQVGKAHQNLLFETLEINPNKNFVTFSYLGNTGSAALPTAASIGIESGFVQPGENVALLGIGSGINCVMLGFQFQKN